MRAARPTSLWLTSGTKWAFFWEMAMELPGRRDVRLGWLYAGPVAVADVNGDGKLDVMVGNECVRGELQCGTGVAADSTLGVALGKW